VRLLGESERNKCVEHGQTKQTQYLVEDIATFLMDKQISAAWDMKVGHSALLPTTQESAWTKKGLRILEAFLKAKGWKVEPDDKGYYKLCEPFSQ
jgi:hypothetical protein